MANIDVQVANGAYIGGDSSSYGKNSCAGIVLSTQNFLHMPIIQYTSGSINRHCVAISANWGSTWALTTLQDFGTSGTYAPMFEGGSACHISSDGKRVFMVAGQINQALNKTAIYLYCRSNTGVWTTVALDEYTRVQAYTFLTAHKSYWRPGAGGTDEIVVIWCEYPSADSTYKIYLRVWNSATGLGATVDVGVATGRGAFGIGYDQGWASLCPHPTTYEPIISYLYDGGSYKTWSCTWSRNSNGTWTSLGNLTDANYSFYNPVLYCRRATDPSGYKLHLYIQYQSYSAVSRVFKHALAGGAWSAATTNQTYTFPYMGIAFGDITPAEQGSAYLNEEYGRLMFYSRGSTLLYAQLPPHTTPSTQYELIPKETSTLACRCVMSMHYPGPNGFTLFPHSRFVSGYALAYDRRITASPYNEVRFIVKDATVWTPWQIPYSIWAGKTSLRASVLLGLSTLIDGQILPDTGGVLLPQGSSSRSPVYQKLQFRNDLDVSKEVSILIQSSAGTATFATGSAVDTPVDAINYTYSAIGDLDVLGPGSSGYLWFKWTPPAGYEVTPVGNVTHKIIRRFRG